jgi:hypothetical protein
LSDTQWIIFNQLGGAEWLRETLDKKAPMPKKYYDAILNSPTGAHHAIRKQTPPLQKGIRATEGTWRTPQANGTTEG